MAADADTNHSSGEALAALFHPLNPIADPQLRVIEEAARLPGVSIRAAPASDGAEIETAMAALGREERGGLIVLGGSIFLGAQLEAIVAAAAQQHLPAVGPGRIFPEGGGLMSYGSRIDDLFRRAAVYVDRILKGAKPADLPVQNPTKFEMVLNQKTATALGVTFSPSLFAGADEIIE